MHHLPWFWSGSQWGLMEILTATLISDQLINWSLAKESANAWYLMTPSEKKAVRQLDSEYVGSCGKDPSKNPNLIYSLGSKKENAKWSYSMTPFSGKSWLLSRQTLEFVSPVGHISHVRVPMHLGNCRGAGNVSLSHHGPFPFRACGMQYVPLVHRQYCSDVGFGVFWEESLGPGWFNENNIINWFIQLRFWTILTSVVLRDIGFSWAL